MTRNSTLKRSKAIQLYTPVSRSSALSACTCSSDFNCFYTVSARAGETVEVPLLGCNSPRAFHETLMLSLKNFYEFFKAWARVLSTFTYRDDPRVVFIAGSPSHSVCKPEVVEVGRRQCNRLIHMMLSKIVRLSCKPLLMPVRCCLHCCHEGSIA